MGVPRLREFASTAIEVITQPRNSLLEGLCSVGGGDLGRPGRCKLLSLVFVTIEWHGSTPLQVSGDASANS